MKINGNLDSGALDKLSKPAGGNKSGAAKGVESPNAESTVTKFSGKLDGVAAGEAPFDTAKVERIRQAIKDGQFTVNPEAIAEKVISSAKELLGQK